MPDILAKPRSKETLATFVARVAPILGLHFSRRESANYVGGEYYSCESMSMTTSISLADDEDLTEFEFRIQIRTTGVWVPDFSFLGGVVDLVARRLAVAGEVVMVLWSPTTDSRQTYYQLDRDAPSVTSGQVLLRDQ